MSFQTKDNAIFSTITSSEVIQKPFVEKRFTYIEDTNASSNYATSQVSFTTETFSNNGKYNGYAEGLILLPVVINVKGTSVDRSDLFLAFKNSNLNLVNKYSVNLNNVQVVQGCDNINQYLIFVQHTEMSEMDETLNGSFLGYAKDSSSSWGYTDAPNSQGHGLVNNTISVSASSKNLLDPDNYENEGLAKRVSYFTKRDGNGKQLVLGANKNTRFDGHMNLIENNASGEKTYYYNCYIRLRDLPFFDKLPLIRSGTLRLTLTLNNNVQFTVTKITTSGIPAVTGPPAVAATPGSCALSVTNFVNNTSTTNPLMFASSYQEIRAPTASATLTSDVVTSASALVASGSANIGATSATADTATANTFVVRMALATCENRHHQIRKCRLYVPQYVFNTDADIEYTSNKIKHIEYLDVLQYQYTVPAGKIINQTIANSMSNMKRLIMIGIISNGNGAASAGNMVLPADSSPFTSEPSTTSPFRISNFNVEVGATGIYDSSNMEYDYEQFIQELNGQQGINANLTQGLCSGRISLQDFNNNYHYIVVNLDRKLPENENKEQSLKVKGMLECEKDITFYCFIEYYKQLKIDVVTGSIVV